MTRSTRSKLSIKVQMEVWRKTDGRCFYCGADAEAFDHIYPISQGGRNTAENLLPSCHRCNSAKKDRHIDDFRRARGVSFTVRQIDWLVGKYGISAEELMAAPDEYEFWGDHLELVEE